MTSYYVNNNKDQNLALANSIGKKVDHKKEMEARIQDLEKTTSNFVITNNDSRRELEHLLHLLKFNKELKQKLFGDA